MVIILIILITKNDTPAPQVPSDRRLKRSIELIETKENGIKLYSFQYLWSDEYFVGVMAQDLLDTPFESAATLKNGYYVVDYSKLGLEMKLLKV